MAFFPGRPSQEPMIAPSFRSYAALLIYILTALRVPCSGKSEVRDEQHQPLYLDFGERSATGEIYDTHDYDPWRSLLLVLCFTTSGDTL